MKLCSFDVRSEGAVWLLPWGKVGEIGRPALDVRDPGLNLLTSTV